MPSTMLSKCGGFVTRRNSQILAKTEQSSLQSACPESLSARLQEPSEQAIPTTTPTTTTATTTTTTFVCPRLCAQQANSLISCGSCFCILLLLILSASYFSSSNALPRRALGRHLILPHRHHVHLRSAGQEHKHRAHVLLYKKKFNCSINMTNYNATNLKHALNVVIGTRASTIDLLTTYFNETEEELAQRYRLHSLLLDYPLKEAVNNSEYDGQITKSSEDEVLDIYYSLAKIGKVLSNVTDELDPHSRNNYFKYIVEMVEHNIENVLAMVNCTAEVEDSIPDPFHRHPCREYGIVSEFVKLLHVLEKKYEVMLMQKEALEEAQN